MIRVYFLLLIGLSSSVLFGSTRPPYEVDAATVHLFHFEAVNGDTIAANAVAGGASCIAFNGALLLNDADDPQPTSSEILGSVGADGFGKSALIGNAKLGMGLDWNKNGGFQVGTAAGSPDALPHSSLTGLNGEVSMEAIVKLPTITGGVREIISTDSAFSSRGFQFRISTTGRLEFNFIATSGMAASAAIPTAGNHAFAPDAWFHVAMTHDGTTTRLYWTRLDSTATEADLIGISTSETTLGAVMGPLVIGNEARLTGNSSEGLVGLIDEVRISRVARRADEFLFQPLDLVTDDDGDGLPDAWERLFSATLDDLTGIEGADFDGDGASDLTEYEAGSHPKDRASTPEDTDGDGLPDAQELHYFGNLSATPESDPDGDGETTGAEISQGSAPNHRASNSTDIDADGLPDVWENEHFGHADHNGGSDPDRDGFGNLQEWEGSTSPTDPTLRPEGTAVKLVPLDDGDHATSDFGFAGSSAINTVAFVRSSIQTFGNQQFVTWYGRHQHDAGAGFNNTIWIGRRTLGSPEWEIFRRPSFTANNINDGHDVICFGIDGDGFMHLSWGMHGDDFHYARSTAKVDGDGPIVLGPDTTMTGQEAIVTYPQFLRLPGGDLLFLFRRFYSGNGAMYVIRYHTAERAWTNVHQDESGTQQPFMSGMWAPGFDYNPYINMPQLGSDDGNELTLTFSWRYLPVNGPGAPGSPAGMSGYQTNNQLCYARSPDAGVTWLRSDGTSYTLPITRNGEAGPGTIAEVIAPIAEGSSLINQAGMCLDGNGNPVTATWWAPETAAGNFRRQYMVSFRHDDGSWQTRAVSKRTVDPTANRYSENFVRNLGRPLVVNDDEDRLIVVYRDNQETNGLTVVHTLPKAQDPDRMVWIEFDLTRENLGSYEPIMDFELWARDRQLHLLYQASAGEGYAPASNTASRVSVLEWDAAAYFSHRPQPKVAMEDGRITLTCPSEPSWSYRLWSSTNLTDWVIDETRDGTGSDLVFERPAVIGETRHFWRIEMAEGGF